MYFCFHKISTRRPKIKMPSLVHGGCIGLQPHGATDVAPVQRLKDSCWEAARDARRSTDTGNEFITA